MSNPFILTFGKEPINYISRLNCFEKVKSDFLDEISSNSIYMITGVRGSGKTVLLTLLSKEFESRDDWIVVDLNPERDMLNSFLSQLYNSNKVKHLSLSLNLNISFNGIGVSIGDNKPSSDVETVINKVVKYLHEKKKKILISIDDAASNDNIKMFAHTFQGLLRKGYAVYLLMTGLYENIDSIQNNNTLTFLSRTPKIMLDALNLPSIRDSYKKIFSIDDYTSIEMAKLTSGYAYAYQVLGYLMWNKSEKMIDDDLLSNYDHYLAEFVYDRLWENISEGEKDFLELVCDNNIISAIAEKLNKSVKALSTLRSRLIKRGIITSHDRGKIEFALPRFKEYIENRKMFDL